MAASPAPFAPGTIGARVEAAADAFGDRPILEDGDLTLTAAEVAGIVRAHARAIADSTAPGDRIAVLATTDAATLLLLFGIAAAGRIAVPVDPREPTERLDVLLERAAPTLRIRATAPDDGIWEAWPFPNDGAPTGTEATWRAPTRAEDPALLLFTSGTTGTPKGIARTHRMLVAQAVAQAGLWPETPVRRLGNVYPPSFLGGILNFAACLEAGATCHLLDASATGPGAIASALRDQGITIFLAVPSLLRTVTEQAHRLAVDLSRLDVVGFGGEAVTAADLHQMRSVMPRARLINCYGAQEAGTAATHVVQDIDEDATVPAGVPMPESTIFVVDGTTRCPPETVGEVLLAGPNVCVEYWRDPVATARARVEIEGVPAVRTGDLGRWRADGVLEIIGRTDHRVKVRGQGVDLSAVQAALAAVEDVADAAVTSLPDPSSGNRLVAHVRPAPGAAVDPVEVRRALRTSLPGYMVPGTVLITGAFPVTARGKLDRSALHDAALHAGPPPRGRDPRTPTEVRVRALMGEVLAIPADDLGCDDDFVAHGGDSLRALELLEALGEEYGPDADTRVTLEEVFANEATVEVLSRVLDTGSSDAPPITLDGASLVPLATPPGPDPRPCYFVLGAGHRPLGLRTLAARLDGVTLWTFLARGVAARRWPDRTVAAMARRYAGLVRAAHPGGPMILAGYSFGGIVAVETARALRAHDAEVPLVVVIDAPVRRRRTTRGRLHHAVTVVRTETAARLAPLVIALGRSEQHRREALLTLCGPLAWRHDPAPYDGDLLVVRADTNGNPSWDLGWGKVVTGTVRVAEVPGTHESLLRAPDADALGRVLSDAFAEVTRAS